MRQGIAPVMRFGGPGRDRTDDLFHAVSHGYVNYLETGHSGGAFLGGRFVRGGRRFSRDVATVDYGSFSNLGFWTPSAEKTLLGF